MLRGIVVDRRQVDRGLGVRAYAASHEHAFGKTFPRIAETGTTDEVLELLSW
ncbi:hypothetical protein ACIF9R_32260 [Streptomyces sp. NPDC086080]|uniref:hypothetical protein n=1 Tax=Streptomyces sp. NPDC086080 TaxID=3365748 RepID=UPI0037D47FBF